MDNQCLDCYKNYLKYFNISISRFDIISKIDYCKFCRKVKDNCIDKIRPSLQKEINSRYDKYNIDYYDDNYYYNYRYIELLYCIADLIKCLLWLIYKIIHKIKYLTKEKNVL